MNVEKVYQDTEFSNAVIPEGSVLIFTGYDTGTSSGTLVTRYKSASGVFGNLSGKEITLGVVDEDKKFQAFAFVGTTPSDSGDPETVTNYKSWNSTLPAPVTPGGGMDDLEFFDWMTILDNN